MNHAAVLTEHAPSIAPPDGARLRSQITAAALCLAALSLGACKKGPTAPPTPVVTADSTVLQVAARSAKARR